MSTNTIGGILRRIGNFDPSRFSTSFSERLILQKTVYLLKEGFGIPLPYEFNWYVHGPYSPRLARDAYELAQTYSDAAPLQFTDPRLEKAFERFLEFIRPVARDEM